MSIDHLQGLTTEIERFAAALDDLDATVPTCPDWRVRDLVHHLGSVHRMFRRVADDGWMQRPPPLEHDDRPSADDDAIVAWAASQSKLLVDALARLDPAAPRWNFSRGPQVGAFITRRMHHETAVHRWDVEGAGGTPLPIGEESAADGVLEYLEVHLSRRGAWEGAPAVLHVRLAERPPLEVVLPSGGYASVTDTVTRPPDVLLAGGASPMLLAWWGRRSLLDHLVEGDSDLVADVERYAYG